MSAHRLTVAVALLAAAAAQPALADDAKARNSGGGSSSAGAGHHSSSSGSSSHSSSGSSSGGSHVSGSSKDGSSSTPVLTDAQRRHPRAGTGTGSRGGYYTPNRTRYGGYGYGGYGYGYGGYGYGYRPYYRPYSWGYGYYPWSGLYFDTYWGGPSYSSYRGGYYRGYRDTGSVRVLVDQEQAQVFVDGYYAGGVDDFDGLFQRLYLSQGRHAITVKLEGFQTHTFDAYVPSNGTLKLHWDMVRGSGDDGTGDPTLHAQAQRSPAYRGDRNERYDRDEADGDADDGEEDYAPTEENRWPRGADRSGDRATSVTGDAGSIRLDVRPDDASVYVDGAFRGAAHEVRSLDLGQGSHRIEIVRPGYRTFEREVKVEGGESTSLNVTLER